MKAGGTKIEKDLVLVGGGHTHVQVVKSFGMKPEPGVRVTLVSPDPHTPYSGMLPGLIAGHYTFDESHIDLNKLCRWAGVRYVQCAANGVDPAAAQVLYENRPPLRYDVLSIDTGSTPAKSGVPGAADFAVPVKPISQFLAHWEAMKQRAAQHDGVLRIAVVGAGAGGVELLLAVQHALNDLRNTAGVRGRTECHLFSRGSLLPSESENLRAQMKRLLQQRGVHLHENETVSAVEKGLLRTTNGGRFEADEILWVTAAGAPDWPRASGLAVDSEGFIAVRDTLQSIYHERIFAAGDVAAMIDNPRPKAGVFAVRQGPVLTHNLRAVLRHAPLRRYRPQSKFLKILATGSKHAIASRGNWTLAGDRVWRWKDSIDRKFMAKFNDPPDMPAHPPLLRRLQDAIWPTPAEDMRCGGCGAKIGSETLSRALAGLQPIVRDDVRIGLNAPDDAAVVSIPAGQVSVQTVDAFRAMVSDPFVFGQIAAQHALGDIYAMGAKPQSALAIVTLPANAQHIVESDLRQMMHGAVGVLNAAGATLAGGHTGEGLEASLGFAVSGIADPARLLRKGGLRPGDMLILTKPLGAGALLAADMRGKARGRDVSAAIASMLQSNARAARIFNEYAATACTDVTGFGLAGHLLELLRASQAGAEIDLKALSWIAGAREAMEAGIFSTMHPENAKVAACITGRFAPGDPAFQILFDPQTAGGLLASVAPERAQECIAALVAAGYAQAAIVGAVLAAGERGPQLAVI